MTPERKVEANRKYFNHAPFHSLVRHLVILCEGTETAFTPDDVILAAELAKEIDENREPIQRPGP